MTAPGDQLTATGWTADDSTFGARLALIRQRMAWGNVKEAAVECGLPPESWRTWERDGVAPRRVVEIAALIANRTGCDHAWLVMGPVRSAASRKAPAGMQPTGEYIDRTVRPGMQQHPHHAIGPAGGRPPGHPPTVRRTARLPRGGGQIAA